MTTAYNCRDNEDYYDMSAIPQGHCIIINNVHFEADNIPDYYNPANIDRLGSDVDANRLQYLFGDLLNFTVTRVDNVSLEKLRELLTSFSQDINHTRYNGLIVSILSHGDSGDIIYTTDGHMVKIHDIAKCFTTSNCPSLSNKPKVFIIQACRGSETNHLQTIPIEDLISLPSLSDTQHITNTVEQHLTHTVEQHLTTDTPHHITHDGRGNCPTTTFITAPDDSDTLYAYATLEDHTALRDCVNGSWFIQELVSVIEKHVHDMHLMDMLMLVNKRIIDNYCNGTEVQVSQVTSSLRKHLFLLPPPPAGHQNNPFPLSYSTPVITTPACYSTTHCPYEYHHNHSSSFSYSSHHPSPSHLPHSRSPPLDHSSNSYSHHHSPSPSHITHSHSPSPSHPSSSHSHHPSPSHLAHPPFPHNRPRSPTHPPLKTQLTDPSIYQTHSSSKNNMHKTRHVSLPVLIETTVSPIITESGHYQINMNNDSHTDNATNILLVPKPPTIKCTTSKGSLHSLISSEGSILFSAPPSPPPEPHGDVPIDHLDVPYHEDRGSVNRSSVASCNSIPDNQKTYKMNQDLSCPQGYCIIINNNTPYYTETKLEQIQTVFGVQLGFHTQIYTNLTRKAIIRLLTSVASVDHSDDSHCLIVIIMSKGGKQRLVYGADGKKLHFKELLTLFSRDLAPTLTDKPKLFFIDTQLEKEGEIEDELRTNIPDTYIVSTTTTSNDNNGHSLNILLELSTSICNEYLFQDEIVKFCSLQDVSQNQLMYSNNLTKPLHFITREPRDSLNEGHRIVEEIKLSLKVLSKLREASITELETKRHDILRICQNVRRTKVAGATTSLVGGAMTIVGFALIPVTLGGSIALSVLGAGVGVTGGALSIASTVTDKVKSKGKLKNAQAILEIDRQLTEQVNTLFTKLNKIIETEHRRNPNMSQDEAISILLHGGHQLVRIGAVVSKTSASGLHIARTAIQGSVFALKVAGPAAKGVAVVGGVVTALTLPLDIYELVSNSIHLYKKSETEAGKWFNEQLTILHEEKAKMEEWLQ